LPQKAETGLCVRDASKIQRFVFLAVALVDLSALAAMAAVSDSSVLKKVRARVRVRQRSAKAARADGAGLVTVATAQVNIAIHAALGVLD